MNRLTSQDWTLLPFDIFLILRSLTISFSRLKRLVWFMPLDRSFPKLLAEMSLLRLLLSAFSIPRVMLQRGKCYPPISSHLILVS